MVDQFDPVEKLKALGVPEDKANEIMGKMSGPDYVSLIDSLSSNPRQLPKILDKYGIKGEENRMTDNYLGARFENLKGGKDLDETFGVMSRVNESFRYAVEVTEQTRDSVLDWLDENEISYLASSPLFYTLECQDRETAYKTGNALSRILRKSTVTNSVAETESVEEMANNKKRANDAKKKLQNMKPRNPIAALPVAGRAGAMSDSDPRKSDKFGRGAKHKPRFDEEIGLDEAHEYSIGDNVMVGEIQGTIKIPHGPNGTIGVLMDGHLEMVSENDVSRLDEGVFGMQKMNPLFRLRELAGIKGNEPEGFEVADAPTLDPQGILAPGPVGDMPTDPVEVDTGDDMDMGTDAPMDVDTGDDMAMDAPMDPMAGMPGDIGSDPVEPIVAPTQSDAMSQIEDSLNGIQASLADIRLSEYKTLIQKLQDLTNQAQMMGRDYLGERRKK